MTTAYAPPLCLGCDNPINDGDPASEDAYQLHPRCIRPHPATFSEAILAKIADAIAHHLSWSPDNLNVLDPFAGIGNIHRLGTHLPAHLTANTFGIELEPEWAAQARGGAAYDLDLDRPGVTTIGDARNVPAADGTFDAVATSCVYPNRMTDHHEAKDGSARMTYRHKLDRPLTPGNAGQMPWGDEYRQLHLDAWTEARRLLAPWGILVLNIKDHLVKSSRVRVAGWHAQTMQRLGFWLVDIDIWAAPGLKGAAGANHDKRTDGELVLTFTKAQP